MYKKTLALSALVGFIIGLCWKADWQWSLEAAQVLAGIISLPANNPMAIFAKHLYAPFLIWPQVGLLKLGLSTESISIVFSGLQSAVSFMSVTALLLVLSQDRIVSLIIPIIFSYFAQTLFVGHSYDIFFPTNLNNGGILAFYTTVFAIASLGFGKMSIFLFLLGILPSIHPGIALGVWLGTLGYYIVADRAQKQLFQRSIRWFIYGVMFFVITAIIHRVLSGSFIEQATSTEKQIVDYFVTFVDGHRRPKLLPLSWAERIEYFEPELMLFVAIWLFVGRYKRFITTGAGIVLRFLGAMSCVGVVMTILWEAFSLHFPSVLKTVMFARWLNFDSIIIPLFLVGALSYQRVWGKMLVVSMVFFFGVYGHVVWRWVFIAVICSLEVELRYPNLVKILNKRLHVKIFEIISFCMGLFIVGTMIRGGLRPAMQNAAQNTALILKLSQGEGLFISSYEALPLPQAITNRGLVFNLYWIDTMTYVPTMADEMEVILNEVYGISIFEKDIWPSLAVIRTYWEKRTYAQWQDIKMQYGARDVVTPKSWVLKLPKVIESETLTVYHIP